MVEPNIHIVKSKIGEKCILCDTFIEKGEKCLVLSSSKSKDYIYNNVKIHIGCIDTFFEEVKLVVRKSMLKELK